MPSEIIVEFPSPLTDKEKKMIYGCKGEVVRCKDCKYASLTYDGECKYCQRWKEKYDGESTSLYLDGDFYCAFGERENEVT